MAGKSAGLIEYVTVRGQVVRKAMCEECTERGDPNLHYSPEKEWLCARCTEALYGRPDYAVDENWHLTKEQLNERDS